jgi:tetratricopeptide (TPR) repeat protein
VPFYARKEDPGMKKFLLVLSLLLSLMLCVTTFGWAGGLTDAKAGLAASKSGNYDEAIRLYTKAIESAELSQENLSKSYNNRGIAWHGKGEYDKAIADYTKAIELGPKYVDAYYNRGLDWYEKGEYDKAIADYTKAIELDPKYVEAYYNRGNAWDDKGDYDKADADYDKAIELLMK